jgi:hypothetical protein
MTSNNNKPTSIGQNQGMIIGGNSINSGKIITGGSCGVGGPTLVPAYYYGPGDAVTYDANQKAVTSDKKEEVITKHPKAKVIKLPDGTFAMECVHCEKQVQWAEANQQNGSFICYGCKNGL